MLTPDLFQANNQKLIQKTIDFQTREAGSAKMLSHFLFFSLIQRGVTVTQALEREK